MKRLIALIVFVAILLSWASSQAAPKAELWARWQRHDPASARTIDHGAWDRFLKQFVVAPHPSGIHRVRYQAVGPEDRSRLKSYLKAMQAVAISEYRREEQKAYWINLYNALTLEVVLSRYPVASIRDINISPGVFSRGPWGAKLLTVEGEKVSLDDIEHRILRPIWRDPRVHYAVNCASLGCPNLQPVAYTAENTESLLDKGAREYINHPRGVAIQEGRLRVSSIYVWFRDDFGGGAEELREHWLKYAGDGLAELLGQYSGGLEHRYDWMLNGQEAAPGP